AAVAHLKGSAGGRCSFITSPPWRDLAAAPPPGAPALLDRVSVPERFSALVAPLLAGAYLADDLAQAVTLAAAYPRFTFVTRGGDLVQAGGIVNGGSPEPAQQGIIHKKREIKSLSAEVERLSQEVQTLAGQREARR